jgi:hypothetical protein
VLSWKHGLCLHHIGLLLSYRHGQPRAWTWCEL